VPDRPKKKLSPSPTLVGRRCRSQDIVLDGHLVKRTVKRYLLHLAGILGARILPGMEVDGNQGG